MSKNRSAAEVATNGGGELMIRFEKGDTVLIKSPTKANPVRLIQACVRYAIGRSGKPRQLTLVKPNGQEINLYEDSPDIVCKVDTSEEETNAIST